MLKIVDGRVKEKDLLAPGNIGLNSKRIAKFQYSFAVDGGAISNITMRGGPLPAKSKVVGGRAYVVTALAGGAGAKAGISLAALNDIISTTVVGGAPWNASTTHIAITPTGLFATDIAFTAGGSPTLDISVNTLTAGQVDLWLEYIVTD